MRPTFRNEVHTLKTHANRFDPESNELKLQSLNILSKLDLEVNPKLVTYFETLLFLLAYPSSVRHLSLAEKEMLRITRFLRTTQKGKHKILDNSGMPFTHTTTHFTHDCVRWLLAHPHCNTTIQDIEHSPLHLNDVLKLTLPSIEKGITTAGMSDNEIMDFLLVPSKQRLPFIIQEFARLDSLPYIKDHLFEQLKILVDIAPTDKSFSKAYSRIPDPDPFFHHNLIKKFDSAEVLDIPLPASSSLPDEAREQIVDVVKKSMALRSRETDPTTYMAEHSFRLYHLERGIAVAIYDMIPSRQLPLESYVGYTAFKNGFPVAYGGAWIFGGRANFGINIFDAFRSGESAYLMAQLLRVYRNVFHIQYFEVEPYQFGLDNPEGIESGAFWFYYRFGFRPLDKHLLHIAKKEAEKIAAKKGYRTSHKTLVAFTGSSIGLKLGTTIAPRVTAISAKVTRMIQHIYKGNRTQAEIACRQSFITKSGIDRIDHEAEYQVLTEVALWSAALNISDPEKLAIMASMIYTKPKDVYAYQDLLTRFFA